MTALSASRLRSIVIDLAVMSVIGVLLALLGPFDTYEMPLARRLVYWLGLAYAGYACYRPTGWLAVRWGRRLELPDWGAWVAAWLVATLPLATFIWLLGGLTRPLSMPTAEQALATYVNVAIVGGAITLIFFLIERRAPAAPAATSSATPATTPATTPAPSAQPAPAEPAPRFLDRLPPELGTDLIALQMEDHYVRAHTVLGNDLVLMRMRDAVAELDGIEGMQVHRSWWVARGAVSDVRREGRNVRLLLEGGLEAPVSRASVQPLKDAGWI